MTASKESQDGHMDINNILYIVSILTLFNASASSLGSLIILLF